MQNVVTALGIYPFAVNQFNKLCQFPALQPSECHCFFPPAFYIKECVEGFQNTKTGKRKKN